MFLSVSALAWAMLRGAAGTGRTDRVGKRNP
jgi:hypothetical protein